MKILHNTCFQNFHSFSFPEVGVVGFFQGQKTIVNELLFVKKSFFYAYSLIQA
ncbi:hypothetical protein J2X69_002718 [Algoriphagus sp. 4150]|nr:hypothetical protein [Algoriphagus sp. 4150]